MGNKPNVTAEIALIWPTSPAVCHTDIPCSPSRGTVVEVSHPIPSVTDADVLTAVADPRRRVVLDGVHNFRDLGGYPADGGTTRWGTVYRADGLQRLTPSDIDELRRRGRGAVIDLRTDAELDERGRFPVDQHDVSFHHLPVLDRTWLPGDVPPFDNANDFLLWAYADMLRVGSDKLAAGLEIIAAAGDTPLVFHCAAGKDRTGLLAAFLLSVLGVPEHFIAADYAKTEEGMLSMRAAWRVAAEAQGPEALAKMQSSPVHYFESPPEVMLVLLADLRAKHGTLVDYVRSLGVSDDAIAALRERLIERH